ncbi:MAG: surface-adhesin E family protein [Burkholderiaceae bacterium]
MVVLLSLGWACASAQPVWLTVAGDPDNENVNTVQVDPVSIEKSPGMRTMTVRVSRATQRTSWDGIPYRSYVSSVLFDCRKFTARYLSLTYHVQPRWQGEPVRTVEYEDPPRWMEFRDIQPNPNQRIIAAACGAPNRVPRPAP